MGKKSQMEIMGLAVIVVLLALGMFFIVAFRSGSEKPKPIQKTYSDEQLATNFILALLKTSSGCEKLTIDDLIQDCAIDNKIFCSGMYSCDYLNLTIHSIITKTLDGWGTRYNFTIEEANTPITFVNNCNDTDETNAVGFQPIPLYPRRMNNAIVKLKICKD